MVRARTKKTEMYVTIFFTLVKGVTACTLPSLADALIVNHRYVFLFVSKQIR